MITPSGLSVFFGPESLITTVSGEHWGQLYGGAGGDYIFQSGTLYKILESGVTAIRNGYVASMTNIYYGGFNQTLLGVNNYPRQRFYLQKSSNEQRTGWVLQAASASGISVHLLSDDGDRLDTVPILTGNLISIGNRIDRITLPSTSQDSDTGIPQVGDVALITDLQAAI